MVHRLGTLFCRILIIDLVLFLIFIQVQSQSIKSGIGEFYNDNQTVTTKPTIDSKADNNKTESKPGLVELFFKHLKSILGLFNIFKTNKAQDSNSTKTKRTMITDKIDISNATIEKIISDFQNDDFISNKNTFKSS